MSTVNYFIDPKTRQQYPAGGCIISDRPSDASRYGAIRVLSSYELPSSVDLRQLMTPIENQLQTNSWLDIYLL